MKFLKDVREQQRELINTQIKIVNLFVESKLAPVREIKSVLLSGSVARGTFMPGKYGGAIDVTLMVEDINNFNKEKYLGRSEEDIPDYFIIHPLKIGLYILVLICLICRRIIMKIPWKY